MSHANAAPAARSYGFLKRQLTIAVMLLLLPACAPLPLLVQQNIKRSEADQPALVVAEPPAGDEIQTAKRSGPYPELYAAVDAAFASLRLEPLPPVRNSANTGWLFPWNQHWIPPNLEGIDGAQYHLPFDQPYLFQIGIEIEELGEDAEIFHVRRQKEASPIDIPDLLLPPGIYQWRLRAYYHSMSYDKLSDWTDWQPLVIE